MATRRRAGMTPFLHAPRAGDDRNFCAAAHRLRARRVIGVVFTLRGNWVTLGAMALRWPSVPRFPFAVAGAVLLVPGCAGVLGIEEKRVDPVLATTTSAGGAAGSSGGMGGAAAGNG